MAISKSALIRDASMCSVCYILAESYNVKIDDLPESYNAAYFMYHDDTGNITNLAKCIIHAVEECINTSAHEISSIMFPDTKTPYVKLNDGSSFELNVSVGKKKSWIAGRSISRYIFIKELGLQEYAFREEENYDQDPLGVVANLLHYSNSPDKAAILAKSLVSQFNFITLNVDLHAALIQSTAFFYTNCGNADKRVILPQRMLEARRKSKTLLRCIYDHNWVFDFRIRKYSDNIYRLEWFLKDYPIGVIRLTTPIEE